MMKIVEVIPNPYIALDKDGVPQGVVSAGMPGAYVGAQVDLLASRRTGKNRFYFPRARTDHKDAARNQKDVAGHRVARVKLTAEMATAILAGELILVNREDAQSCGLAEKEFLPAEKAMEAEMAKALSYYKALRGKDAKLGEIPREAEEEDAENPLPPETGTVQLTPTLKMKKEG